MRSLRQAPEAPNWSCWLSSEGGGSRSLPFPRAMSQPLANQPVIGDPSIQRAIRWIARQSLFTIYVLSWGVTAAAACYGATIIFGFAAGYALPPAALFALLPAAHRVPDLEPFLPWPLLGVAAIGALCGWAAAAGILPVADLALGANGSSSVPTRLWANSPF